jgi:hypothetical protein
MSECVPVEESTDAYEVVLAFLNPCHRYNKDQETSIVVPCKWLLPLIDNTFIQYLQYSASTS